MTSELELADIQGLILSGYGNRPHARYAMFEITDQPRAKAWLASLVDRLQFGEYRRTPRGIAPNPRPLCLNVAFTHAGFEAIGLHPHARAGFHPAFQEGLADENRARRLGDDGESDPIRWAWGRRDQELHGVLAFFGDEDEASAIDERVADEMVEAHGVRSVTVLSAHADSAKTTGGAIPQLDRREHFGFRDGISNPGIRGLSRRDHDVVEPGEILLGYKNGYRQYPLSPEVPPGAQNAGDLARTAAGGGDFGKNGSYLVFRQLEQDVHAFWDWVTEAAKAVGGVPEGMNPVVWLASKMVGRWPNGTPMTLHPDKPGAHHAALANAFTFGENGDAFGERCPIGSHIRRTNPRDTTLPQPHDVELSGDPRDPSTRKMRLDRVALHRILRRGRLYGPRVADFQGNALSLGPRTAGVARGLHFLCFNANLARQFEFVQSNWMNNPGFAGLSADPDPLVSAQRACPFPAGDFTMQGFPPRRVRSLGRFVEVRGGAYFFMPGKRALTHLART